jgi:hypothetical protein
MDCNSVSVGGRCEPQATKNFRFSGLHPEVSNNFSKGENELLKSSIAKRSEITIEIISIL